MAGMSDLATYVLAMAQPKAAPRPRLVVPKLPPGGGKGGRTHSGPGSSGRRRSRTPPAVRAMRWLEQPGMQVGSQGEETAYRSVGLVDMEERTRLTRLIMRQLSLALQPNQPSEVHLSSLPRSPTLPSRSTAQRVRLPLSAGLRVTGRTRCSSCWSTTSSGGSALRAVSPLQWSLLRICPPGCGLGRYERPKWRSQTVRVLPCTCWVVYS